MDALVPMATLGGERNWMLRRGTTANYTTQPPRVVVSFM
jgi:hypothetical protein